MMIRVLLVFLVFLPLASHVEAAVWNEVTNSFGGGRRPPAPPSIRIRLIHGSPGVDVEVQGQYTLYDPNVELNKRERYIDTRYRGKCRYFQALGGGLKWGEEFPNLHQLKIVDDKPSSKTIIEGHIYKGPIYVYDVQGSLSIVNEVSIEEYVRGVLDLNVKEELEPEMLYALAIATRTNAYFQSQHPKNKFWAVDAKEVNYEGLTSGSEQIYAAVRLTKNMVMSLTGIYEGLANPFPVQFGTLTLGHSDANALPSKITIQEANEMAKKGEHAAQILAKAFPGSIIMLVQ